MADDDLIAFMSVLAKVSSVESKNIMDLFKKHDTDLKQFLREVKKLNEKKPGFDENTENTIDYSDQDAELDKLSPEKKEKLVKLIDKLNNKNE